MGFVSALAPKPTPLVQPTPMAPPPPPPPPPAPVAQQDPAGEDLLEKENKTVDPDRRRQTRPTSSLVSLNGSNGGQTTILGS